MSTRRRFAHLVILCLLLVVMSAISCKKEEAAPTATPPPSGTVVVQWSIWGGSQHLALYQQIINLFEAQHPDIKVELVTVADFMNYLTKLQTLLAAGTPPDVISLGNEWFPAFMSKGAFADLTPYAENDPELDLNDYIPRTLQVLTHDGKLYALPTSFSVDALFYNKDAFDAAGVPYPDETGTAAGVSSSMGGPTRGSTCGPGSGRTAGSYSTTNATPHAARSPIRRS
jgi:multiple sugar transport system substrate-binding protein